MKKLIKLCTVLLAVVSLLSLTACSARSPITADEFTKQAKAQGFTVNDASSSGTADVDKYLTAIKSETGTEISFVSFKDETAAESFFNSLKKSLSEGSTANAKTLDSATYNKYTVSVGELSHTLVRMDTTIVYGKATTTHQNQVDDFFKAIKY